MRPDHDRMTRVHAGEFLHGDRRGEKVHPGAAEPLLEGDPEQAQLRHESAGVPRKILRLIVAGGDGSDLRLGELPHHLADHLVVVFQVETRVSHSLLGSVRAAGLASGRSRLRAGIGCVARRRAACDFGTPRA